LSKAFPNFLFPVFVVDCVFIALMGASQGKKRLLRAAGGDFYRQVKNGRRTEEAAAAVRQKDN
jgi:hypothetical protein